MTCWHCRKLINYAVAKETGTKYVRPSKVMQ